MASVVARAAVVWLGFTSCMSASASEIKTLYLFKGGLDASFPDAAPLQIGTSFYGTSEFGGSDTGCEPNVGCGTVYKIEQDGSDSIVAPFAGPNGGQLLSGLTKLGGVLYGLGYSGGAHGYGTILSITRSGVVKNLHSFEGKRDGSYPVGKLVVINNVLYGVTGIGGGEGCSSERGCGTVFSMAPTGYFDTVHRFRGRSDGAFPQQLTVEHGALFGVTGSGGGSGCYGNTGCGTVLSISASGAETVLHRFVGGSDGASPKGSLIDIDGTLYGVTDAGGSAGCNNGINVGCGVVFSISKQNIERIFYVFAGGSNGSDPNSLIKVGSTLLGAIYSGGTANHGTLFSLAPEGSHQVLYSFKERATDCSANTNNSPPGPCAACAPDLAHLPLTCASTLNRALANVEAVGREEARLEPA